MGQPPETMVDVGQPSSTCSFEANKELLLSTARAAEEASG